MASSPDSAPHRDRLEQAASQHRLAASTNLVANPAPFYDLYNVELQLGNTEAALIALLQGLDVNVLVADYLLHPASAPAPTAPPPEGHPPSGSPQEALAYLQHSRESWPQSSLDQLARILEDSELRSRLDEVKGRDDVLKTTPTSGERYAELEQLLADRRRMFGTDAARELHARLFEETASS